MANEVKRRRKPRDLPQRTPTGLIMHILWRVTAFALILVLTFSMIAGITACTSASIEAACGFLTSVVSEISRYSTPAARLLRAIQSSLSWKIEFSR